MPQVVIENPILNSPFAEPRRHFDFTDDGITDRIVERRRLAGYFIPIPPPTKKGKQLQIENWTADRWQESEFINRVRERIAVRREQCWPGVTAVTTRLLEHWADPGRERRLFFCQLEAIETAIYLAEVAESLEDMPEVLAYLKNDHLAFKIPYTIAGTRRSFLPDFLVRYDDGLGLADPLHLILEVSGEKDDERDAKVSTARAVWVPAVNHLGTFGRWAFYEIRDPWSCQKEVRDYVLSLRQASAA